MTAQRGISDQVINFETSHARPPGYREYTRITRIDDGVSQLYVAAPWDVGEVHAPSRGAMRVEATGRSFSIIKMDLPEATRDDPYGPKRVHAMLAFAAFNEVSRDAIVNARLYDTDSEAVRALYINPDPEAPTIWKVIANEDRVRTMGALAGELVGHSSAMLRDTVSKAFK